MFGVGMRIQHPVHGPGTVRWTGGEYVAVAIEQRDGEALLRTADAGMTPLDPAAVPAPPATKIHTTDVAGNSFACRQLI